MDKTTLSMDLKRRLMVGMKKKNLLLKDEKNESSYTINWMYASRSIEQKKPLKSIESEANDTPVFQK